MSDPFDHGLPRPLERECLELLDAYLHEEATEEKFERLQEMLRAHDGAQTLAVNYLHLHGLMERAMTESVLAHPNSLTSLDTARSRVNNGVESRTDQGADADSSLPVIPTTVALNRLSSLLSAPLYWTIGIAALFFGLYASALLWNLLDNSPRNGSPAPFVVATISGTSEAGWGANTAAKTTNDTLSIGENLRIESGLVELKLAQGATVVVEGPAEIQLEGSNAVKVAYGKVLSKISKTAIGFTLYTPTATIVDLGTEFGADVARDGSLSVQVLQGEVSIRPEFPGKSKSKSKRLVAGQKMQINNSGESQHAPDTVSDRFGRLAHFLKRPMNTADSGNSPLRLIRLSPKAVAKQSSSFASTLPASAAIDGNFETFSHTGNNDAAPRWQLDLGESRSIASIVLHNRSEMGKSRLRNIVVTVLADDGETVVAKSPVLNPGNRVWGGVAYPNSGPVLLRFNIFQAEGKPVVGRHIVVERGIDDFDDYSSLPGIQGYLTLAEVEIFELANADTTPQAGEANTSSPNPASQSSP